ncbi:UDP-glucose 6-dehydrogenase [Aeromonas veronii]|uniref:UDP-glucose 6-dehydrogenase n=1 Tax=Aeromonas veronii TaxID=654 RepID=UPI0038D64ADD
MGALFINSSLSEPEFFCFRVFTAQGEFKEGCDVISANLIVDVLADVMDKVYIRDLVGH